MAITSISFALEAARASAGLTQRELAARAKTAQSLIARIERGQANPTMETLTRLFDAAGCELTVTAVPRARVDPLTEAYKSGVDRTLLRENLSKTPQQRVATLLAMARFKDEAAAARAGARKKR